ncbi:MAG: OsmC family protein [Chloroflexota bacterium]
MSGFRDYLDDKRTAVLAARERVAETTPPPRQVTATVTAADRAGVRRVRIRDHHGLLDSGPEMGGFDLGPSPVESLLGALGGCLAHTIIVQAAARQIPLDAVTVEVAATVDPRAGHPAFPDVPIHPTGITWIARIQSPAETERLTRLVETAERVCPVTALLTEPQPVSGSLIHIGAGDPANRA